jgi:hypothetical protein
MNLLALKGGVLDPIANKKPGGFLFSGFGALPQTPQAQKQGFYEAEGGPEEKRKLQGAALEPATGGLSVVAAFRQAPSYTTVFGSIDNGYTNPQTFNLTAGDKVDVKVVGTADGDYMIRY